MFNIRLFRSAQITDIMAGLSLDNPILFYPVRLFSAVTDLCIGFHSTHGWELMIASVYKDFVHENLQPPLSLVWQSNPAL